MKMKMKQSKGSFLKVEGQNRITDILKVLKNNNNNNNLKIKKNEDKRG